MAKDPSQVVALDRHRSNARRSRRTRKARLEFQGLTGVASMALTGGAETSPALEAGPDGAPPIIYADRSDFQNLLENVQRLVGQGRRVLEKADKLLADNSSGDHRHVGQCRHVLEGARR